MDDERIPSERVETVRRSGDDQATVEAERRARRRLMDEGSLESLNELLRLWRRAGREDRVRMTLEMLIDGECGADLERRALLQVYLGQSYERTGEWKAAAAEYRQALALEPADSWTVYFTHNNLGYCLNALGRHEEAERLCRAAVVENPRRHNAWKNLGISHAGQGRHAEAFDALVEASRLQPADTRAYVLLERLTERHPGLLQRPGAEGALERCRAAAAMVVDLRGGARG